MIILYILAGLICLPVVVKLGVLYIAYLDWALRFPIICSIRLFNHRQPIQPKKGPLGFAGALEPDPEGTTAKRKK